VENALLKGKSGGGFSVDSWPSVGDWRAVGQFAERSGQVPFDAFVGVSLVSQQFREANPTRRGTKADAQLLVGIFADVDLASDKVKKLDGKIKGGNLPTRQAALDALHSMPIAPSIVWNSGVGLQTAWLLKEPLGISAGNLANVEALIKAVQAMVGERHGCAYDSVCDVTRVMRLPGSVNCKYRGDPLHTSIVEPADWRDDPNVERYCANELVAMAGVESVHVINCKDAAASGGNGQSKPKAAAVVDIDDGAPLPRDKFDILLANNPKFAATWNRQRPDFQSASEYDLSLASLAVCAGWIDDSEVGALIRGWRTRCPPPATCNVDLHFLCAIRALAFDKHRRWLRHWRFRYLSA
jgi:hypothetical protein